MKNKSIRQNYHELIFAVARKIPGETRHETALRYIREAESLDNKPKKIGPNPLPDGVERIVVY